MQVGRVKQHHVTYLLLQKRINSGDFTAIGAFVGGKKRRKEERRKKRGKRRGIIDSRQSDLEVPFYCDGICDSATSAWSFPVEELLTLTYTGR